MTITPKIVSQIQDQGDQLSVGVDVNVNGYVDDGTNWFDTIEASFATYSQTIQTIVIDRLCLQ